MNKLFFLSIIFCSCFFIHSLFAKEVKKQEAREEGVRTRIIEKAKNMAILKFYEPTDVIPGRVYQTSEMGVYFKVLKVSPRKTMVYGQFNQAALIASKNILIFDKTPYVFTQKKASPENKLSYSLFYTFSFGNFFETVNGASAESSQNSPFTIGGALGYKFNKMFSFSGSTYFSKLNSALSTGDQIISSDNKAEIPWEYGVTSYLEYSGIKFVFKPYIGLDYESFSTFNTDELKADPAIGLDVRTHQFLFSTFGVFAYTKFFNRPGIFKASFSNTFTSSSSRNSTVSNESFNGQKFILFFGTNVWKKWGASILYKQHIMKGPTDLTISRLGFGVSYRFQ